MSSDRRLWQPKLFIPAVALLFLIYGLEMFLSARLESQTFDEPAHLYAGYSYWLRSDFGINPEHPPLVKLVASLPLLLVDKPQYPEPGNSFFRGESARDGARLLGTPGAGRLLNHARTAVSVFAFLLAVLLVVAAREMFGETVALFALTLFVFDPLLVAHGPLLGTDVGATCCIFATVYAFYRYLKRPSPVRLGVCAVAAGFSLAAKHSAILVFPILILLAATEVLWDRPAAATEGTNVPGAQSRGRRAVRMAVSLAVIAAVSVTILWAFYGFRYAARPGGAQITPPTAIYLQGLHHPVEAKAIGFAERHHLLPEAYLYGFTDVTMLSRDGRVMYLFRSESAGAASSCGGQGDRLCGEASSVARSISLRLYRRDDAESRRASDVPLRQDVPAGPLVLLSGGVLNQVDDRLSAAPVADSLQQGTVAERRTPRGVVPCHSSGYLLRRSAGLEARHRDPARDSSDAVSDGAGGGGCGDPGTSVARVGLGGVDPAGAACGFVAARFSERSAVLE